MLDTAKKLASDKYTAPSDASVEGQNQSGKQELTCTGQSCTPGWQNQAISSPLMTWEPSSIVTPFSASANALQQPVGSGGRQGLETGGWARDGQGSDAQDEATGWELPFLPSQRLTVGVPWEVVVGWHMHKSCTVN